MQQVLYKQKSFDFVQKRTVCLGNSEGYLLLLKFPKFMNLIVSNHAYSVPALTPSPPSPSWVLSHSAASSNEINRFIGWNSSLPIFQPWPVDIKVNPVFFEVRVHRVRTCFFLHNFLWNFFSQASCLVSSNIC